MVFKEIDDKEKVREIRDKIKQNGGYCLCQPKQEDSKCVCKDFVEQKKCGTCRCGLYVKVEV